MLDIPKKLIVFTAEYDGEYELHCEHYEEVAILSLAELNELIGIPDIDARIEAGEFAEDDVDRADTVCNVFESAEFERVTKQIECWGRNCETAIHVIDTENLTDSNLLLLYSIREFEHMELDFSVPYTDYTAKVLKELKVSQRSVITFGDKELRYG